MRKPLQYLKSVFRDDYYIVRFQEPGKIEEFARSGTACGPSIYVIVKPCVISFGHACLLYLEKSDKMSPEETRQNGEETAEAPLLAQP
ncbi:hypothetical protein Cni_G16692 [Canna indica]|uniref:Uncharacterized protein n=1 Tax=Canna indica TaxID=4628 RepID=A0AAQ3KGW9_9LILI|nr:hypothetical protein Cni_G16692 [Canna indica]